MTSEIVCPPERQFKKARPPVIKNAHTARRHSERSHARRTRPPLTPAGARIRHAAGVNARHRVGVMIELDDHIRPRGLKCLSGAQVGDGVAVRLDEALGADKPVVLVLFPPTLDARQESLERLLVLSPQRELPLSQLHLYIIVQLAPFEHLESLRLTLSAVRLVVPLLVGEDLYLPLQLQQLAGEFVCFGRRGSQLLLKSDQLILMPRLELLLHLDRLSLELLHVGAPVSAAPPAPVGLRFFVVAAPPRASRCCPTGTLRCAPIGSLARVAPPCAGSQASRPAPHRLSASARAGRAPSRSAGGPPLPQHR
eukprot:scaffold75229_cov31-Tisochrysis_lutea.AAC.2